MPVLDMFQYQGQCCLVLSYMPNTLYSFLELHPIDQTFIDSIAGSATTNTVPTATSTNTIPLPTIIPPTLILPLPSSSSSSSSSSAFKLSSHTNLTQYDTHTSIPTHDTHTTTDTQTHNNTHIHNTYINEMPNKIQYNKHDFNIDSDIIRKITLNIITSLYILHTNNIIHCDIKPENCFINTVNNTNTQKGRNSDPSYTHINNESTHNDTHSDNTSNNNNNNNTSSNILPNKRAKSSYDTSGDSHTYTTNYSAVESKTVPLTNYSSSRSSNGNSAHTTALPPYISSPPLLDHRIHTTHPTPTTAHTITNTASTTPPSAPSSSSSSSAALYSTAPTSYLSSYSSINTYITLGDMGSSIHTSELPGYYTDFNIQSLPYRAPEVRGV